MIFDVVIFILGAYLIIMSINMKSTGKVPAGMINSKIDLEKSKDIPGFIKEMYFKNMLFGIILLMFGVLSYLADTEVINPWISTIITALFFISLIAYAILSSKAVSKYLL